MRSASRDSDLETWRRRARRRLPRFVFDYIEGGAETESSLTRNTAALQEINLLPARLTDVTRTDAGVTYFGRRSRFPLIVGPTGLNGLIWPDGDIVLGRAAAQLDIPFVLSTASSTSLETVARECRGDRWFQLYMLQDRRVTNNLIDRAALAGYRVLVVTTDVPIGGRRLRDVRNGFTLPMRLTIRSLCDSLLHLRWLLRLMLHGPPTLANLDVSHGIGVGAARTDLALRQMDRSITWNAIESLRSRWQGPIILKGILSQADTRTACECGVEGIVVSNHGGRQLDALVTPTDMLDSIVDAARGRLTVLIDSGFRSGSDVIKALSIGADGVLIARPVLYGLGAAGGAGVIAVLRTLVAEIEEAMVLTGSSCLDQLRRSTVVRIPHRSQVGSKIVA